MPKNIDPGQRAQKKDARKGAAFFALVQLAMALLLLWGRSQLAGLEGLEMDREVLHAKAMEWEIRHAGRTPRVARQFIASLLIPQALSGTSGL